MPRKLPPFVERWRDRHGKMRHYFRKGKGARFPLPWSRDGRVQAAYQAALMGQMLHGFHAAAVACSRIQRNEPEMSGHYFARRSIVTRIR